MLVTFTTDAYADITMFGDVALALLKMMGHSGTVPSAIQAAEDEPQVSISNRALPLINLLTAAAQAGSDVMWK